MTLVVKNWTGFGAFLEKIHLMEYFSANEATNVGNPGLFLVMGQHGCLPNQARDTIGV
jgi:hypothetical protein